MSRLPFANSIITTPEDQLGDINALRVQALAHMYVVEQILSLVADACTDFTPEHATALATRASYLVDETLGVHPALLQLIYGEIPTEGPAIEIMRYVQQLVATDDEGATWKIVQRAFDDYIDGGFKGDVDAATKVMRTRLRAAHNYLITHHDVAEGSADDMLDALNSVALDWPEEAQAAFTDIMQAALTNPAWFMFHLHKAHGITDPATEEEPTPEDVAQTVADEETVRRRLGRVLDLVRIDDIEGQDPENKTALALGVAWLAMHPHVVAGSEEDLLSSAQTVVLDEDWEPLQTLKDHLGIAIEEDTEEESAESAAPVARTKSREFTPEEFSEAYQTHMQAVRALGRMADAEDVGSEDVPEAVRTTTKDQWMIQELQLNPEEPNDAYIIAALTPLLGAHTPEMLHELWQRLFLIIDQHPSQTAEVFNLSIRWLEGPGQHIARGSADDLLTTAGTVSDTWAADTFVDQLRAYLLLNDAKE
ncbi:MAG: hypothetical protein H6925_04615 [Holosporaceae bacterium]|nr:MAG: hypothetical protein H6925_04615 [Holosporaceae bacterium]